MSDHPIQEWNPRDPEVLDDQRGAYDAMRERCPVAYSDAMKWSIFRHADVMTVLNDPDTFMNSSRHHAIPNAMNGDEHTTHRAELARYFTDTEMQAVEPRCRSIAAEVVNALVLDGPVDAVTDIAEPIALRTMCVFLGWPEERWERVRDWIHGNRNATFHRDREAAGRLASEYAAIVTTAIEEHRRQGIEDDVTGRLMRTEIAGQQWNDDEIVDTLRNWIAGHGSVAATIGIIFAYLAERPDLQRRLRDHPDLIAVLIDEIPRSDGPLVSNSRTTTREVTIGGRTIPAGERLSLMWIAADRDSAIFPEPDEIQLDRSQADNLLYGAGIHYCLGAPLARLEARVAVEVLLAQTAGLMLATDSPPVRETYPGNGFVSLPVRIDPVMG
jgi:cytochrome P450